MIGDATLFQRSDSVMAGWSIVQPLLEHWAQGSVVPLARYAAGSEGPKEAEEMLNERGHHWKPLD